jgi:hypothetical protein
MANSATLTFEFADESIRKLKLDNLSASAIVPSTIKPKIQAVNASLLAGTAGGLSTTFVSDAGAAFVSIAAAQTGSYSEEILF